MKRRIIPILLIALLFGTIALAGCSYSNSAKNNGLKATIFKSASCGCCVGFAAELERQGFEVETINSNNLDSIKEKYKIPRNMQSCHTTVIDDYFVEGHVPIKAVEKLLEEKPDIDGIALPNMPSGSPGMPGPKRGLFKVYSLKDGQPSEFTNI